MTRYILAEGGAITALFWFGQVLIGGILPMILVWYRAFANSNQAIGLACVLVVLGGLSQMYVTIIGGLTYPLILFPGMEVSSSFYDGIVNSYTPTLWEVILGVGGIGIALIMVTIAVKYLRFLPESLADAVADPHHRPAVVTAEKVEAA